MDVLLHAPQPTIVEDKTPTIFEQAAARNWPAGQFHFGKAEAPNIDYFNPGLVERPDGLWLLARRAVWEAGAPWGQNSIVAIKLNDDLCPLYGKELRFLDAYPDAQFEDPRAVYHAGKTWVAACNYLYMGARWTGAHQTLGVFENDWSGTRSYHPVVGGNGEDIWSNTGHEKNWPWFFHENKLHLLYQSNPWQVYEFNERWTERKLYQGAGLTWDYGEIRGGTPPVKVDDLYWTFFHSSLPWEGKYRRYYMGVVAFKAGPPFDPVRWSLEPLLIGSLKDRWHAKKPPCVFPCGSVIRNGEWIVTYGINDLNCGWVKIKHEKLWRLTTDQKMSPKRKLKKRRARRRRVTAL